jgi:hypothetical protein
VLKRSIGFVIAGAAVLALAAYAADFLFLQVRIHANSNAFGTIVVQPYYAVPQKNGKYEFLYSDPRSQTCVRALFPHLGDPPCWYLARHTEQRIDM